MAQMGVSQMIAAQVILAQINMAHIRLAKIVVMPLAFILAFCHFISYKCSAYKCSPTELGSSKGTPVGTWHLSLYWHFPICAP